MILNAGVFNPPTVASVDGHESTYAVNHLGHFYLTLLLLPKLRESGPGSRLVIVSSALHSRSGANPTWPVEKKLERLIPVPAVGQRFAFLKAFRLYATSKLCNVLMAFKLHREENGNGINTYVLHPGSIPNTSIGRNSPGGAQVNKLLSRLPMMKNLEQGAATTVYCAALPDTANVSWWGGDRLIRMIDVSGFQDSGKYYENCWDGEGRLHKQLAHDQELQDALWERSMEQVRQFETKESAGEAEQTVKTD